MRLNKNIKQNKKVSYLNKRVFIDNMRLEITLDDLDENTFVYLEDSYRRLLFKRLLDKGLSLRKLNKILSCDAVKSRKGIQWIRLKVLRKIQKLTDTPTKELQEYIVRFKFERKGGKASFKLPITASPELAALVSHSMGDGHIYPSYRFGYWNKDKNMVDYVCSLLRKTFGDNYKIWYNKRKKRILYEIVTPSIIGHLLYLAGAPIGRKVLNQFQVPKWILNSNQSIQKSFIRALLEDESHVRKSQIIFALNKYKNLKNNLKMFLEQIQNILIRFKINDITITFFSDKNNRIRGRLYLSGKKNLENFRSNIGFQNSKYLNKLNNIISEYKQEHLEHGEAQRLILNFLNNKILSTRKIQHFLKKSYGGTKWHLYCLEGKGLIKRWGRTLEGILWSRK